MNNKQLILNKLLDKYEKGKSLTCSSNRRIILKLEKLREYDIENYEAKKMFHDVVLDLSRKEIIFYSWKPHEVRKHIK